MPNFSNSTASCYVDHQWSILSKCSFPQLAGATGGSDALFGLLMAGAIFVPMWVADSEGRLAAPSVLCIIIGGAMLPMLPGDLRGAAWTMIILGMAASIGVVAHRYVLNPAVRP